MERQRKFNKDNPKFNQIFADRLDAILAIQKSRPTVRPRPSPRVFVDGRTNEEPQNEPSTMLPPEIPNSRPKVLCPANEATRKLVIREMIERNRTSRRLSIPRPDENIFSSTSHRDHYVRAHPRPELNSGSGSVLSTTILMARPPEAIPMTALQRLPRQSQSTTTMSTSVPASANIGPESLHRVISTSNSTPLLLSPPESPNLIDFPSSDDSSDDDENEPGQLERVPDNAWTESRAFTDVSYLTIPTNTTEELELQNVDEEGQEVLEADNFVHVQNYEQVTLNENLQRNEDSLAVSSESVATVENPSSEPEITSDLTASASNISLDDSQLREVDIGAGMGNSQYNSTPDVSLENRPNQEHDPMPPLSRASSSSSGISSVSYDSTPGGLKVTDKVIWFTENGVPECGTVQWVGTINERFHAGVEFDNPVGNSSGKVKGKRLFVCPLTHGRFVPVSELMFREDYYHNPCPANNEPSSCPNGFPDLNSKNDGDSMPFVCVICQDDLLTAKEEGKNNEDMKEMCTTKCGHLFHADCLNAWFKLKPKLQQPCPYCQRLMNIADTIRIFPVQGKR